MQHRYFLRRVVLAAVACVATTMLWAQTSFGQATTLFLLHSSGNHLERGTDDGGWIESPTKDGGVQQLTIEPDGQGYYSIRVAGQADAFLSLSGQWNTLFVASPQAAEAKWAIEQASGQYVRLRCKANNKYLGTDSNDAHQKVFADKSGSDTKHLWYFSTSASAQPPTDTLRYRVAPQLVRQHFDGWGVSLCWWAGQCGKWDDKKIDEIVDWLVSPTGLNYSHFRYNIGGGDDPENRNCTPHHMGSGKGLRAEMEGFKDFSADDYHWERDSAQRKIMLKIREKRPDAVFEAFSNSCPYYMTYSGCVSGNAEGGKDNLKPEYYEEFAHYLVDVCKHYKDAYGIEFKTLEPFNESATSFWHAGGVQEGCHFDYQSQVAFLRVLSPILKQSGLSTVISASDETNVGMSIGAFRDYTASGVLPLVGQWNTHTYQGSNAERAALAMLVRQAGVPLWMSETGSGGSGIGGNLSMAQRLLSDMTYMQPEAWIDWQYMEEANDQWCTIRGSFASQTYAKVKNYYVRQHCSRFIRHGFDIVASLCPQTLAAVNEQRDTLVLVVLNEGAKCVHNIDLTALSVQPSLNAIQTYRTTASENMRAVKAGLTLADGRLTLPMPAQSIATLLVPISSDDAQPQPQPVSGGQYLIVPRQENLRAVTATGSKVTIEDVDYGDAQRWTLTQQADGTFALQNALGLRLTAHRSTGSSSLTAQRAQASEQGFYLDAIDQPFFTIMASNGRTHGFDLSGAATAAGTTVGIWQYQDGNATPIHRQWMLFPLGSSQQASAIREVAGTTAPVAADHRIYDLTGRRIDRSQLRSRGIYLVNGRKVVLTR